VQRRRDGDENDPVLACRGMGILPMIPTGPPPEAGDATWGMAFFAVKGTARARPGRGSPSISPAERGAGQDAGDTCASLRALRTLRFHPQPPVTEALPLAPIFV